MFDVETRDGRSFLRRVRIFAQGKKFRLRISKKEKRPEKSRKTKRKKERKKEQKKKRRKVRNFWPRSTFVLSNEVAVWPFYPLLSLRVVSHGVILSTDPTYLYPTYLDAGSLKTLAVFFKHPRKNGQPHVCNFAETSSTNLAKSPVRGALRISTLYSRGLVSSTGRELCLFS